MNDSLGPVHSPVRLSPPGGRRFREVIDRDRRGRTRFLGVLTVAAGMVYVALLPGALNPSTRLVSGAYFMAEFTLLAVFLLALVDLWTTRSKPASGLRPSSSRPIDVLIPVSDESGAVVERALTSAACLEWDGPITVYVLDESSRLSLEVRARELGFEYLAPGREGYGPGRPSALNLGLARSAGELILVLDADHVVRSDALVLMAGYLDHSGVAFVQSRPSADTTGGDPFGTDASVLTDAVQRGFDRAHSAIACGSTTLYAREALEDLGGFADGDLREDLSTSYALHGRGWKSLYFPHSMSRGIPPANVTELYGQRGVRAADALRIFLWDNPLLKHGLSWRSRLDHLVVGLAYLWAAVFLPVFLLIPIWSYVTGAPLVVADGGTIASVRLVYLALSALACASLFPGRRMVDQLRFLVGLFPSYLAGLLHAVSFPFRRSRQTAGARKRRGRPATAVLWLALLPQVVIVGANLTLPVYALARGIASTLLVVVNLMVSAVVVWALWPLLVEGLRHRGEAQDAVQRRRLGRSTPRHDEATDLQPMGKSALQLFDQLLGQRR
jgi:cellulose synthase (UDP-forming)